MNEQNLSLWKKLLMFWTWLLITFWITLLLFSGLNNEYMTYKNACSSLWIQKNLEVKTITSFEQNDKPAWCYSINQNTLLDIYPWHLNKVEFNVLNFLILMIAWWFISLIITGVIFEKSNLPE